MVDFEGSWTKGWVDEEYKETAAGDLQGLRNIREFLRVTSIDGNLTS